MLWVLGVLGLCGGLSACGAPLPAHAQAEALIDVGRRLYHAGVLPDGRPLIATRPEGLVLEGVQAACGTCHRPSGMGSVEGPSRDAILVPPVAGPVLFAPARFADTFLDDFHHDVPNDTWRRAMTRPAYDDESLEVSLRKGRNSAGELMAAPMPLYDLGPTELASLSAYLRALGAAPAPGVEADAIHVATVVTPDVPPAEADAVLGVLEAWSGAPRLGGSPWIQHVWRLKGSPDTWGGQLEDLYRARPVFALLSGRGRAEWRPVQEFCERERIACVMPSVDIAPVGQPAQYSMYLSPGVELEARVLLRHLRDREPPARLIQVYGDPAGEHAGRVLVGGLSPEATASVATAFDRATPETAMPGVGPGDVVVLWLRSEEVEALVSAMPEPPAAGSVVLSALLANPEQLDLPSAWKAKARFVSLFDDLSLQAEISRLRLQRWLEKNSLPTSLDRRLQADAYAAAYLLNDAIADIRRQEVRRPAVPLTREHVLEALEDEVSKYSDGTPLVDEDSHIAYYGRMSLGPGQRVAVRGGSILRYASPDSRRLVAVSEHIVP